jgi:hypothetical protein
LWLMKLCQGKRIKTLVENVYQIEAYWRWEFAA